jgi:hypothetical protein
VKLQFADLALREPLHFISRVQIRSLDATVTGTSYAMVHATLTATEYVHRIFVFFHVMALEFSFLI